MGQAKGTKKTKKRSETVSVRFDERLRYLAEISARVQKRTLSSFIDWAVETALVHVNIGPRRSNRWLLYKGIDEEASERLHATIADVANELWDYDEADRFVHLAFEYEHLLNRDEQVVWKLIRERPYFWRESTPLPPDHILAGDPFGMDQSRPKYIPELTRVREYWDHLKAVAKGQEPPSTLPTTDNPPAKAPAQATPTPKAVNRKPRKD